MQASRNRPDKQAGQGMTEYVVIVALIAVAAIGTYSLLGQTVRTQTAGLALEIAGTSAQATSTQATASSNLAQQKGTAHRSLKDYHEGNTN